MKKKANRTHPESAGVERVDHDGETQVVEPGDIEVSQKERLEWYENGSPDEDERLVHKRKNIETSYDDGGNPMWTNESHRTSKPRPHQYSIERRLQEARDPGSTYDITSDASIENATAKAFTMISPIVQAGRSLDNSEVVKISSSTGVPVQNIMSLETIAQKNTDLASKYAGIPGVVDDSDEPGIEKESEPAKPRCRCHKGHPCDHDSKKRHKDDKLMTEDELNQIGTDCGLC